MSMNLLWPAGDEATVSTCCRLLEAASGRAIWLVASWSVPTREPAWEYLAARMVNAGWAAARLAFLERVG